MGIQATNLTNHFLIAMPSMADPRFAGSLTYIAEHNDQGALGVIINRPIEMTLDTLFERVEVPMENQIAAGLPVYFGGPVQSDRGFVLHHPAGEWHSTLRVSDNIALTSSRDILQAIGARGEPGKVLVALGYAGWNPGQLEQELADNAWLTVEADMTIIFDLPYGERLTAAMHKLGVDITQLSEVAGHA